jgi:SAM-dependent methyltransferase
VSNFGSISIAGCDTATPLNLRKRTRILLDYLDRPSLRLLDCGCGAGEYVATLVEQYQIDAFGVEYSSEKVRLAHARKLLRHRVFEGNLEEIPFPVGDFDAVLLNEVLEHVPNEKKVLTEIHRVLRPGGQLIVFSPNRWFPFETHGVELKRSRRKVPPYVPLVPYVPAFIGRRLFNYWARNYWHRELRELIARSGFDIERRTYIWQTFENISGTQPRWMELSRPLLRRVSDAMEKTPGLRQFGVSQVVIARKPETSSRF